MIHDSFTKRGRAENKIKVTKIFQIGNLLTAESGKFSRNRHGYNSILPPKLF